MDQCVTNVYSLCVCVCVDLDGISNVTHGSVWSGDKQRSWAEGKKKKIKTRRRVIVPDGSQKEKAFGVPVRNGSPSGETHRPHMPVSLRASMPNRETTNSLFGFYMLCDHEVVYLAKKKTITSRTESMEQTQPNNDVTIARSRIFSHCSLLSFFKRTSTKQQKKNDRVKETSRERFLTCLLFFLLATLPVRSKALII